MNVKELEEELLREYGHAQMKFEVAMHQRRMNFHENPIAVFANSSQARFGFLRLMVLQMYENTPLRKADIAKMVCVSYQSASSLVDECLEWELIVETEPGRYIGTQKAWNSHKTYLEERLELSSDLRVKLGKLQKFREIYQPT